MAFAEEKLPEELTWAMMVLLPKGEGGVWGYQVGGSNMEDIRGGD